MKRKVLKDQKRKESKFFFEIRINFFYLIKNNKNNIIKFDIIINFDNLKILFFYSLKI